jgi:hypothetical protein
MYWATILNGITIHEIACCSQFLLATVLDNPKQLKFPIFWACIVVNVSTIIGQGFLTSTMFWRVYNLVSPQTPAEINAWFTTNSIITAICSSCMQFGLAVVILLRTLKMYHTEPRHWFRIYVIIVTIIIGIGSLGYAITGYMVFSIGIRYLQHPLYRMALFFGGFLMNAPIAFHMTFSAYVFLFKIYSTRGFTVQAFLKDWILKQDGFRYIIVLALNCFLLYCYMYTAMNTQTETTTLMFYAYVWVVSACLMTFMENSYSTTKSVMKNSQVSVGQNSAVTSQSAHHVKSGDAK